MPTSARFVGRLGGREQKDGVWDGRNHPAAVSAGGGRDDVGIVPYIRVGTRAIHRAGVVPWGATFRLFVSATGFALQLSAQGRGGGRMLSYGLPPEGCRPYEVYTIDQLRKIEFRLLLTASWKRCRPKDCS